MIGIIKTLNLKFLQFSVIFFTSLGLFSLLGGLTTWDLVYFWIGNWDIIPRGFACLISIIFGCMNLFRLDGKVLQ